MSNIFITEIVGSNTYAIPTGDAELAAATSGFDALLSVSPGVANLTYDRVLAWVEDSGGPGATEGVRSLNCMIEKFTYIGEECPPESDVDAMIAAIESALESDSDITSVGNQQVHIFQAGAYFLWNRDASGGFLFPNTATDDVAIGPFASPTGKWFDDGDLVLGGNVMSGTEKLRVVGAARIEGNLTMTGLLGDPTGLVLEEQSATPYDPTATSQGTLWVRDDNPNVLVFTDNAGTDTVLGGGSGSSPWTNTGTVVHLVTSTDTVAIGASAMSGTEKIRIVGDALVEGKLTVTGLIDPTGLVLEEQSATPYDPTATSQGTLWVRDDSPNVLVFTDNAGTDTVLGGGSGSSPWTNTGTVVHLVTSTDTVAVGASAMSGTEKIRIVGNVLVEPDGSSLGNINIPAGNALATQGAIYEGGTRLLRRRLNSIYIGNNGYLSATEDHNDCIIIGDGAFGANYDTSDRVIAIGTDVLKIAALSTTETLVAGYKAAATLNRSQNSVIIGSYAQQNHAGYSDRNVIIGDKACQTGSVSTTNSTSRCVVIGASAGTLLANTADLVIIGYGAATSMNNLGSYNIIVGALAATRLTSGQYNSFVGYQSGDNVTTGAQAVAVGYLAMGNAGATRNGGNFCVAVGGYAMNNWLSNASFTANTAVGYTALGNTNTSATTFVTGTTAIGSYAGSNARDASYSVYIGNYAGQTNTRSHSLFIGTTSGRAAVPLVYGEFDNYLFQVNGKLNLVSLSPAVKPPFNLAELSAAPSAPVTNDIYLDDGTNTGSGSPGWRRYTGAVWEDIGAVAGSGPWTSAAGVIYPATLTDTVAINSTTMSATANEYLFVKDDDESSATRGIVSYLEKNSGASSKTSWTGVGVDIDHSGTNGATSYIGFDSDLSFTPAGAYTIGFYTAFRAVTSITDASAVIGGFTGLSIQGPTGSGTLTTSIGVNIGSLGGTSSSWGVFQTGTSDQNFFAGDIGVNFSSYGSALGRIHVYQEDIATKNANIYSNYSINDGFASTWHGIESSLIFTTSTDTSSTEQHNFTSTVEMNGTGDADGIYGFYSSVDGSDASGVVSQFIHFYAASPDDGTATATSVYGIRVDDMSMNSTNAYGVYISDQTATNSWGIYQNGVDDLNYFGGHIGVAVTPNASNYIYIQDNEESAIRVGVRSESIKDDANNGKTFTAFQGFFGHTGTGSVDQVRGFSVSCSQSNTGDIDSFDGLYVSASSSSSGGVTGTFRGAYINGTVTSGQITNAYGIYIASMEGTTLSYGIYQSDSGDDNYFAGNVGIGDSTPSYALDVAGDVSITDQLGVGTNPTTANGITVHLLSSGSGGTFNSVEAYLTKSDSGTVTGSVFEANATINTGAVGGFAHFRANSVGGTGTYSAVYGLFINGQYSSSNPTATSTYGVYQSGSSDNNYFAGPTLFGAAGTIDAAAIVEFSSTTKGVLFPRMSSDPSSPPNGLVYYNSTTNKLRLRASGAWVDLN